MSGANFLTPREVCKVLKVSYPKLLRLVRNHEVPVVRIGNRLIFPASYLESLEAKAYGSVKEVADVSND